jgi:tetratricopeptide (TPR) repeat protein
MIESKLDTQEMVIARQLALAHYKAGSLCQAQEDVNESIVHLEKGRTSIKQTEGDNQDTEAMIADTLGVLYASKEDYIKAKQYFSDSYSLYEQTLGREHITTSDCAFRLAECLEHVGSNLALDFYLESLRVHRLHIDNDDERAGTLLFSIGRVHLSKDAFLDAVTSFDEVRSLYVLSLVTYNLLN